MRTLLLADDSVTTQRVIALTFAEESFRVVTVSDGQQATDAMAAMRPDIVLAATTLPRTNGYELSAHMRDSQALRDVPVLLLSGAFESVDAARVQASGARGVIEKPLEPTAVISRVRELLGLKEATPAAPAGRLLTSAGPAPDHKPAPARQPPAANWDELSHDTGQAPGAPSVEAARPGSGREDYLDTLDAAFDSLDHHLAGRDTQTAPRNPSGPLGQAAGAPDPRSPGRRPSMTSEERGPNSVFEVDNDWFSNEPRERDLTSSRNVVSDAHESMPPRPVADPANAIFEVDDEWFADDDKARANREAQARELAAEMGIHEVEMPAAEPVPAAPAPAAEPEPAPPVVTPAAPPVAAAPVTSMASAPAQTAYAAPAPAPVAPPAPVAVDALPSVPALMPPPSALFVSEPSGSMADDFAALLAFETGDGPAPQPAAPEAALVEPVAAQAAVPEITEDMLDQIAQRVADRLNGATFGAELRAAMTAAVRDTVRSVVAETSERMVRDEIARVRARAERETQ